MLVLDAYTTWLKQFKLWKVPNVVGSIVVVSVLTCCALLHSKLLRVTCNIDQYEPDSSRNLTWVASTLTIRKSLVSPKLWILSQTQKVLGKHNISQTSVVCHNHDLCKSIRSSQIVPHVSKTLKNFWLIHVFTGFRKFKESKREDLNKK